MVAHDLNATKRCNENGVYYKIKSYLFGGSKITV